MARYTIEFAVDRNVRFQKFLVFWIQLLETHKKGSQHFRLSRCLKKKVVARYTIE